MVHAVLMCFAVFIFIFIFIFLQPEQENLGCPASVLSKVYIESAYLSCDAVVYSHFEELRVMFPSSLSSSG